MVIILLVLFLGTYIYTYVQLFLKGGVTISIDPAQRFILTDKKDVEDIAFTIEIQNRLFCSAECIYEFRDLSSENVLDKNTFIGKGETKINKTYSLIPPPKGTGQLAYEFYVECINKGSLFCHSGNEKKVKSSFVTLGYELSLTERDFMESVRDRFLSFLELMLKTDEQIQFLNYTLDKVKVLVPHTVLNVDQINTAIDFLVLQTDTLKEIWKQEDYYILDTFLQNSSLALTQTIQEVNLLEKDVNNFMIEHNQTAEQLESFQSNFDLIGEIEMASFVLGNLVNVESVFISPYVTLIADFNQSNYSSLQDIQLREDSLEKSFNRTLSLSKRRLVDALIEGRSLLEENVTIDGENISESISLITDVCSELKNIINSSAGVISYINKKCSYTLPEKINVSTYNFTIVRLSTEGNFTLLPRITLELFEHKPICCIFGQCKECCDRQECTDDPLFYPLLFLHSHAVSTESSIEYSLAGFEEIRKKLLEDGYIDAGTVFPTENVSEDEEGYLGRFGKPVMVGTTYYVDAYNEKGEFISIPSKSESIKSYAARVDKSIEIIKKKTGAKKVNIIAFSMGGLVARKYLVDSGEDSVNKLITIGTPNKGTSGRIESFCPVTGSETECLEMASTSSFINELNKPTNKPKQVKVYTIIGKGCSMSGQDGDGAVLSDNAELPYALSFEIEGTCSTTKTLHEELRDINKYPRVYDVLKGILFQVQ